MSLHGRSYDKALDDLKRSGLYRRLGLDKTPSKASVSRWKKDLRLYFRLLLRLTFFRIMRSKQLRKLIAIVDGTGVKLGRASHHYEERVRKRRSYLLVTAVYAPEIDSFFDITATPSYVTELTAFKTYLVGEITRLKIFWAVVADKRYDDSSLIEMLERAGIVPCIPARKGMLAPKGGPRARSDKNYQIVRKTYYVRSLIESGFSSVKSFSPLAIRAIAWESRESEVLAYYLAHNVARLLVMGKIWY